jgi:hypothetical protein
MHRRHWLLASGALAIGAIAGVTPPVKRAVCDTPEEIYQREGLVRLGRACVACNPALTEAAVLHKVAQLERMRPEELQAHVSREFAQGRVVQVEGWVISRSEATIFAGHYFEARSRMEALA